MKVQQKSRAMALRGRGFSMIKISNTLGVSKSTVSLWVRSVPLSSAAIKELEGARQRARQKARNTLQARRLERIDLARTYARQLLSRVKVSVDTARLLCALLYWCEGVKLKNGGTFAFTNSDPLLMETFLKLLRKGFNLDEKKFRLMVHVHNYHNSDVQLRFWSKVTTIPMEQTLKPYKKSNTGMRSRDGYQGCASVRYHDLALGRQLEAIAQGFMKGL